MDIILTFAEQTLADPLLFWSLSFVALLFFGEPIILSIALISATTHFISPSILIGLAILSAIIAEYFWFAIGKVAFSKPFVRKRFFEHGIEELTLLRKKLHVAHPLALLFVTRPFTGLTIVAILLLGREGVRTGRFLLYSCIVNIFWTPVVVGIGYTAGMGYTWAVTLFETVHVGLGTLLVIVLIVFIGYKYLTQKLTRIALDTGEL